MHPSLILVYPILFTCSCRQVPNKYTNEIALYNQQPLACCHCHAIDACHRPTFRNVLSDAQKYNALSAYFTILPFLLARTCNDAALPSTKRGRGFIAILTCLECAGLFLICLRNVTRFARHPTIIPGLHDAIVTSGKPKMQPRNFHEIANFSVSLQLT